MWEHQLLLERELETSHHPSSSHSLDKALPRYIPLDYIADHPLNYNQTNNAVTTASSSAISLSSSPPLSDVTVVVMHCMYILFIHSLHELVSAVRPPIHPSICPPIDYVNRSDAWMDG